MKQRRFSRRAEIAAAIFATLMSMFVFVPSAAAQRVGCVPNETNFLTAHGFCDGFTDIFFSSPGFYDILTLTGPQRIAFDHSSPFSYNSATKVFQVQANGGSREDFLEFGYRVNIGAYVENNGTLIKDAAMFACGSGDPASFCVQAADGTVLLRGQVKGFAYNWNHGTVFDPFDPLHPYDDFAFYVKLIDGTRKSVYGDFMAVTVRGFVIDGMGRAFNGTFTQPADDTTCDVMNPDGSFAALPVCSFGGGILGVMGGSMQYGMLLDACDGQISGTVRNGLLNSPISGNEVSVMGGDLVAAEVRTSTTTGSFAFTSSAQHSTGFCAGSYQVRADVPDGFAPGDLYPTTRTVTFVSDGSGHTVPSVAGSNVIPFVFYPVVSADYRTFGQGAWGSKPRGLNAGTLLQYYYSVVYGYDPVVIGNLAANKYVSMSGPVPVQNFLPQGGRPVALDGPYVDPITKTTQRKPHNRLGALAGETLALQLNVDFSNAGLTKVGLGSLILGSGVFKNCSVNQVLAYANKTLGGGALMTGVKYDDVEDAAELINENFEGGRSRGFLKTGTPSCKVQ